MRLSVRDDDGDGAFVSSDIVIPQAKTPLVDLRTILTGLVLMVPGAALAVVVSYFAITSKLEAGTLQLRRHEEAIVALQKADTDRAVRDAETVTRLAAAVQRLDEILKHIEKLEDRMEERR